MKITHNLLFTTLLASGVMFMTSCAEEHLCPSDHEQYVRDFIDRYGIPDPDHSWTMVRSVATSVRVDGLSRGTVELFTGYPGSHDACMIARLPVSGGRASANVPVPATAGAVYMRVMDSDNTIRDVSRVSLDNSGEISSHINVLALPADAAPPTARDLDFEAYIVHDMARKYYQKFLAELPSEAERNRFTYPMCFKKFQDEGHYYYEVPGVESSKKHYLDENRHKVPVPKLRFLDNLYYETGAALSYKTDLAPIFYEYTYTDEETGESGREAGVFREQQNNVEKYYHNALHHLTFDHDVTFAVREKGPVPMQCIWRGTVNTDYFGYFYYKAGTDLTSEKLWHEIPKYIFLSPEDIKGESSLTQYCDEGHEHLGEACKWVDMGGMSTANCHWWPEHRMVRGRKYYLAYYGENYDQAPTYEFPTGIRIGYFIYRDNVMYFSNGKNAYELARRQYYKDYTYAGEGPLARPFAAKFRMNKRTYVGFGDESGDNDLNDVVFIAENVYPDPVDITPDHIKDPETTHVWTLACEDLGSTDDVDFNDIVLDVAYLAGETSLTIMPRAAGGNLVSEIYFRENNNTDFTRLGEIHNLLSNQYGGPSSMNYPMLNTQKMFHHVDPKSVHPLTVKVPEGFDFASEKDGFLARLKITTRHPGQEEYEAKEITAYINIEGAGKIPQMLLLEGEWQWPTERIGIATAYPDFRNWVKDHNSYDWVRYSLPNLTASHRDKCSH